MILNVDSNKTFVLKDGYLSTNNNSKFNYNLENNMLTVFDLPEKKGILYVSQVLNKDSNIFDLLLNEDYKKVNQKISTKLLLKNIKFDFIFLNKGQIIIEDDSNIKN